MISDVLFEAVEKIEYYQREFPGAYARLNDEIEAVKAAMRELQQKLDTPPTPGEIYGHQHRN